MAILTGPSIEGAVLRGIAKFTYDFAVHGGTVGTINLTGDTLPKYAIVYGGLIDVITAISDTGGTSTASLHINAGNDLVSATATSGAPWSTTGIKAIMPVATAGTSIALTADLNVTITVGTENLLGGKFNVFLMYFRSTS